MKVFISWSGETSKCVATVLHELLPDIVQGIETWISGHDISPGARWNSELNNELETSNFGVLCLTRENLNSSWLLFEAGSISKSVVESRVIPYLFGIKPSDVEYPLAQFQTVKANKKGTFALVKTLNNALQSPLSESRLNRAFTRCWPDLEERLNSVLVQDESDNAKISDIRSDREILDEILQLLRSQRTQEEKTWRHKYSSLVKILDEARQFYTDKRRELIKTEQEIIASGKRPSGMYGDYTAEAELMIKKIEAARRVFKSSD